MNRLVKIIFLLVAAVSVCKGRLVRRSAEQIDACKCFANGNHYSPNSTNNCSSFLQLASTLESEKEQDCPPDLKFNLANCVCDFARNVNCPTGCPDFDECQFGDPCNPNADCTNTVGSYLCDCGAGYTGDGITCQDINECDSNPCGAYSQCTNTDGGYRCECQDGYYGDSGTNCADINECDRTPCGANAVCSNPPGDYICSCAEGYTGDGLTCVDINECDRIPCGANAVCSNTPGDYICTCAEGYTGDGLTCVDIDECDNYPCDAKYANCANTAGGYTCTCAYGYAGDGVTCTYIEETTTTEGPTASAPAVVTPPANSCVCSQNGNYYAPVLFNNCESFLQWTDIIPPTEQNCPAGLQFDVQTCVCNWPSVVTCPSVCY